MARKRDVDAAVKSAGMGAAEIERLAQKLLRAKERVYRRTLRDMAQRFTTNGPPERLTLSRAVRDSLQAEANQHARQIARTHNRAIRERALAISSHGDGRDRAGLEGELREWGERRMRKRARMIAVTEAYGPHADAILSFFSDAGVSPEFEFGGHPDDADPACAICRAITASNPHSLDQVLAIGTPHPNCRQSWHPINFDAREIPPEFGLGSSTGGIVGTETLIQRQGNAEDAAAFVLAQRQG